MDVMLTPDEGMATAKTIADQTYHQLRWDIVSGALEPGAKLAMDMLTKRYGVGMSPLREALVRLTGDALVHAEGQRGFWVTLVSIDEMEDTMKTRTLIESEALARSIELGGADWEQRVRDSYAALAASEEHLGDGDKQVFAQWEPRLKPVKLKAEPSPGDLSTPAKGCQLSNARRAGSCTRHRWYS